MATSSTRGVRKRISEAMAPKRRKAKVSPRQALSRVGTLLAKAQHLLGAHVLTFDAREADVASFNIGHDVHTHIESARRQLGRSVRRAIRRTR